MFTNGLVSSAGLCHGWWASGHTDLAVPSRRTSPLFWRPFSNQGHYTCVSSNAATLTDIFLFMKEMVELVSLPWGYLNVCSCSQKGEQRLRAASRLGEQRGPLKPSYLPVPPHRVWKLCSASCLHSAEKLPAVFMICCLVIISSLSWVFDSFTEIFMASVGSLG